MLKEKINQLEIEIRHPDVQDIEKAINLVASFGFPITKDDMLYRLHLYGNKKLNRSWIAEEKHTKKLVGWAALSVIKKPYLLARIVSLTVDEKYRRHGIGSKLIKQAEQYAKQLGCKVLELSINSQNSHIYSCFYKNLGYSLQETNTSHFAYKEIF